MCSYGPQWPLKQTESIVDHDHAANLCSGRPTERTGAGQGARGRPGAVQGARGRPLPVSYRGIFLKVRNELPELLSFGGVCQPAPQATPNTERKSCLQERFRKCETLESGQEEV